MFGFFKKKEEEHPEDAKGLRDVILRYIKEALQKMEGGEGRHIKALQLFISCSPALQHLYESAVYSGEDSRFRDEIQRIADDFDIGLPANWLLDVQFSESLPREARMIPGTAAALFIQTKEKSLPQFLNAGVRVLNGEAEQDEYTFNSSSGRITIGRGKKIQIEDGSFRINTIAFPPDSRDDSNRYISRQHAHIEYNKNNSSFMLFADEGGVPPGNKVKIKSFAGNEMIKLHSVEVGYKLQHGDQIIIGETAVLEFYVV